jgi:hypothetical protein
MATPLLCLTPCCPYGRLSGVPFFLKGLGRDFWLIEALRSPVACSVFFWRANILFSFFFLKKKLPRLPSKDREKQDEEGEEKANEAFKLFFPFFFYSTR